MARPTEPVPTPGEPVAAALAGAEEQLERLGRELAEIEMLEQQARSEAARHEQRRAQAADRLAASQGRPDAAPDELRDAVSQVVTLTRRSAMMESQVDVLSGKQKALARYRDHLVTLVEALRTAAEWVPRDSAQTDVTAAPSLPVSVSRAILSAQEDMRRDIARAMHDGPAQSLANIVLQAQIVERLVRDDPEAAVREAGALVEVVQHALDATKRFIFNVRPMVLDDLGLVPTLRRLARDRGREAEVPIEFESFGADRRLGIELETGLFRIIDEATAGYAAREPSRIRRDPDLGAHVAGGPCAGRLRRRDDPGAPARRGAARRTRAAGPWLPGAGRRPATCACRDDPGAARGRGGSRARRPAGTRTGIARCDVARYRGTRPLARHAGGGERRRALPGPDGPAARLTR